MRRPTFSGVGVLCAVLAALMLAACGKAGPAPTYDVSVGYASTSNLSVGDFIQRLPETIHNVDPSADPALVASDFATDLASSSSGPQAVEGQPTCSATTAMVYSCDIGDGTILTVRLSKESEQ